MVLVDPGEELFFIQQKNITRQSSFRPDPTTSTHEDPITKEDQLPIDRAGRIDSLLVVSEQSDYEVLVELDRVNVVEDSFSFLQENTDELAHVSAYERNGSYVTSITGYPFVEHLDVEVTPNVEMNFNLIRAEVVLEEEQ